MRSVSGKLSHFISRVKPEFFVFSLVALGVLSLFWVPNVKGNEQSGQVKECQEDTALCELLEKDKGATASLGELQSPDLSTPDWLQAHEQAERQRNTVPATYTVETRGNVQTDVEQFANAAAGTFSDERGWSRMGVRFERVERDGQFVLVLAEASQMTSFSATGCDTTYSCRVGQYVIINEDRWLGATDPWNAQGGSIRDYQHMVVNHETGHWLGHGHSFCPGPGQPAPVMQQQSMDLQGCTFNPWPVDSELTSSQLGI